MTAEEYISQARETESIVSHITRTLARENVPEFSSEPITTADAAKLIGLPESSVRAGILYGWLPIGKALIEGREITKTELRKKEQYGRMRTTYYISPRKIWEETGHIWRGREALND